MTACLKFHAEGNFDIEEIDQLYNQINEKFRIDRTKETRNQCQVVSKPILLVQPDAKYYLNIRNLNPRDKDSAIMLHWQLPTLTDEENFYMDIIMEKWTFNKKKPY